MSKVTPSRKKFRIARLFANELHKIYGDDLKAVFVAGSVGANFAHPGSDIDLVVVYDDNYKTNKITFGRYLEVSLITEKFNDKFGTRISPIMRRKELFENWHDESRAIMPDALYEGAVPIFGDKVYLKKYSKSFRTPSLFAIRKRYSLPMKDMPTRLKFKRSRKGRKRFRP